MCLYWGAAIHLCFHLDVVYSSILLLATYQGIGVWVSFICDPPAAPSLATWSACSFPSVPALALIQARVRYLTSRASVSMYFT